MSISDLQQSLICFVIILLIQNTISLQTRCSYSINVERYRSNLRSGFDKAHNNFIAAIQNINLNSTNTTSPQNLKRSTQQSCWYGTWYDFRNYQTHNEFIWEYGGIYASNSGLRFPSSVPGTGDGSSARMYCEYLFNTPATSFTHISGVFRGAPDLGKNSNFYLIEPGVDGVQSGSVDEVDIVEVYGSKNDAEYCLYQGGYYNKNGPGVYIPAVNPGNNAYTYELYMVRGQYVKFQVSGWPNNGILGYKEYFGSDVPKNPLQFFAGIWDCSDNSWCPGKSYYMTYAELVGLWIATC